MTKPLVFQHGAGSTAFETVVIALLVFETLMGLRQRLLVGGWPGRDPSALVLAICFGASVFATVRLGLGDRLPWPGGELWPAVAGITLIVLGIALRAWSIVTLGRFFQYRIQVQADHRVVSDGPYRYVRHPSYTGVALALIGFAIASGDVLSLPVVLALGGVGLAVRIRAEEQQLLGALGEQYERYAAPRKRLVPGLI